MAIASEPVESAFRFVRDDHAHAPHLRRFRELVAQADGYRRLVHTSEGVLSERKLLRLSADEPKALRWVYLSLQRAGDDDGFEASTFVYSVPKDRLTHYAFPADPQLATLPGLASDGGPVARVLQFVPRQRLVYLTRDGLVAKLMRPPDRGFAYARLCAVHDAVARAEASFRVARPAGIDPAVGVFLQEHLPGRDLAASLTEANLTELLWQAGAVPAELHGLVVEAAPRWSQQLFLRELRSHLELVALYRPREGVLLAEALACLERVRPWPLRPVFCHGDLRCGHLLPHEDVWAAIDFDGCRLGDPYEDVARLLAFLKRDVPFLQERVADASCADTLVDDAIDAFVDGYETRAGAALDRRRLLWYLAAHELHYLARMLKRDLYDAVSFSRGVARVLALSRGAGREPAAAVALGGRR